MCKSKRLTIITAILFAGALLAPLVGFPSETLAEVWSDFKQGYGDDYISLSLTGPEGTTVNSPQITYTFETKHLDLMDEAATGVSVIVTTPSSFHWDTDDIDGTPCSAYGANASDIEALEEAEETGEVISVMWRILSSIEDEPSTASGSTVLVCDVGTLDVDKSHLFTLEATPTEVGTHTITGFATCNEAEDVLDDNAADIDTEVKPHQIYIPLILR